MSRCELYQGISKSLRLFPSSVPTLFHVRAESVVSVDVFTNRLSQQHAII